MANENIQCITCVYASWEKTKNGRLSPTGSGRCLWDRPCVIPASMYFFGKAELKPMGGYINRHEKLKESCLCWEKKDD